jgi:transcriptional regulator with XRE-family HTH domain
MLGGRIRIARHERGWTLDDLAARVGVTQVTMAKVEKGDPSVRLGVAFEAAVIVGVPLFDEDPVRRRLERARIEDRLALLPRTVSSPPPIDDDF